MINIKSFLKIKVKGIYHNLQATIDKRIINERLSKYSTSIVKNVPPKQVKRITFVIERMSKFGGGQTSILRLGTKLSDLGYDVSYVVYKNQSVAEMKDCANSNLSGYKGSMYTNKDLKNLKQDVVIASSWDTVAFAKKMNGYTMYFLQDFEPYFFPFGELFLLALKTYEQGLHMVSLGTWNKEMVLKNCNVISPIDTVDFPYERSEYKEVSRDYKSYSSKKEFIVAVYLKYYGKRLPCIIQYMLKQVKEEFLKDGITLNIKYYGEDKSFKCEGGENLGMLTKKQLFELYSKADFGIVASMSNVSLVPYEMLATGLPLIEFEDGTFPYFFPENSAILTSISYKDLYLKMKEAILNPSILEEMHMNSKKHLETLSWDKTAKQFSDILEKLPES